MNRRIYSGEGCFYVNIYKSKEHKIGYGIALQIILGQHNRDRLLLEKIVNILESGKIYERKNSNTIVLTISNFKDIYIKLIPFFKEYKIRGIKYFNFEDFCIIAEIIKKGNHTKLEGLKEIKFIKSNMNKKRIFIKGPSFTVK